MIKINQNNSVENILKDFDTEITKKIFTTEFNKILNDLSNVYHIPTKILKLKTKQLLYNNFNFKIRKFKNIFSGILSLLLYFIYFNYIIICYLLKFKTKKNFKYQIIIPDVEHIDQYNRFKNVIDRNNSLIIIKNKFNKKFLKEIDISYKFEPSFRFDNDCFKNITILLKILNKSLILSLFHRFNYVHILFILLISIFKNLSLLKIYNAKYMLIDRFYNSCAIRNHYFKKFGGTFSTCIQKSLLEISMINYSEFDILFTIGKENINNFQLKKYCNINETIPMGSFFLETRNNKKKIISDTKYSYDITYIGMNFTRNVFISNEVINSYYEALRWLRDYSDKNQNFNICIKHHDNSMITDKEYKIFSNSNVKIFSKSKHYGESYDFCKNSKILCSFGSILLLEAALFNNNIFFINPHRNNNGHFNIQEFSNLQITTYLEMTKTFDEILKKEEKRNIIKDNCCLNDFYPSNNLQKFFN